jgi:hypothetical protein
MTFEEKISKEAKTLAEWYPYDRDTKLVLLNVVLSAYAEEKQKLRQIIDEFPTCPKITGYTSTMWKNEVNLWLKRLEEAIK